MSCMPSGLPFTTIAAPRMRLAKGLELIIRVMSVWA